MKTAISIPDDLFADAEELARQLKKSRSRLYSDAVREYVERRSDFAGAAARRTFERSDW